MEFINLVSVLLIKRFYLAYIFPAGIRYLILFFLLSSQGLNSQVFESLTEDTGLPTNFCNDIIQDSFGLIWIATENGLVRYDGLDFKTYASNRNSDRSLYSNTVTSLAVGQKGEIWINTNEGVLNRYDPLLDEFEIYPIHVLDSFQDKRVHSIVPQDSLIWIGSELGLIKYEINDKRSEIYFPNNLINKIDLNYLNTVYTIFQDKTDSNLLWLGTRGGLISFHKDSIKMDLHTEYISKIPDKGQYAILKIHQENEILWLSGSWSGIKKYNTNTKKWKRFFSKYYPNSSQRNDISDFYTKSKDEFWISSRANGFGVFNKIQGEYHYIKYSAENPYSIQKGPLVKMLMDHQENIWVIGQQGVSFFQPKLQQFNIINFPQRRVPHGHTNIYPTSFERINENSILVSSLSGDGIYIVNPQTKTCELVTNYIGKSFDQIINSQTTTDFYDLQTRDLIKVNQELIWVAIDTQFAYFNIPRKELVFPEETNIPFFHNSDIRDLQLDSKGLLWGNNNTKKMLFCIVPDNGKLIRKIPYSTLFPNDLKDKNKERIRSFYIDNKDQMWFHTYSKVFIRNMKTGKTIALPNSRVDSLGISGRDFYGITGSEDGTIFLPSMQNGLQIIYPGATVQDISYKRLGQEDGLPIEKLLKVVCLGENAWISTRKGLVKYHIPSSKLDVFSKRDGIPNHDLLNYWTISLDITEEGDVYFGNPDQIVHLKSNDLYENASSPEVFITELKIGGEEKKFEKNTLFLDKISLKHKESSFSIHYSTNDYILTDQQKFKYRLIGYDDDWIEAGNSRDAIYTKVPGGKYIFEIMAANSSGIWNKIPKSMEINIDTPFYKSNIFYSLLALISISLARFLYKKRIQQIREKEKIKSDFAIQLAEVEMRALRAQMNPHFIFNSLNSINKYILYNDPRNASRYLTKFAKLIRLILNNSKSKLISLEDEIHAITLYIELELMRFNQKFDFKKSIKTNFPKSEILIPPMILQTYIENAIWHGLMPLEKQGQLIVSIEQSNNTLICKIDDNGIGRKKAKENLQRNSIRKKSIGMQITSERLALVESMYQIKTELKIKDKIDADGNGIGTLVTLTIPITRDQSIND